MWTLRQYKRKWYFTGTKGCEECEKEGTDSVAIRICPTCVYEAVAILQQDRMQENTEQTKHPVMAELHRKSSKWCYVHDQYNWDIT